MFCSGNRKCSVNFQTLRQAMDISDSDIQLFCSRKIHLLWEKIMIITFKCRVGRIKYPFFFPVNFTWKLVTGLGLSGACLLLLGSLFSCCYLACKEIDYSKTSYGILISVVIMLGGWFLNLKVQWYRWKSIVNRKYACVLCRFNYSITNTCTFTAFSGGCAVSGTVLMTSYYITNLQTWSLDWSFYLNAVGSGISFLVFCLYILYVFLLTFADWKCLSPYHRVPRYFKSILWYPTPLCQCLWIFII